MIDYEEVETNFFWCEDNRGLRTSQTCSQGTHRRLYFKRPKREPCPSRLFLKTGGTGGELRCELDKGHVEHCKCLTTDGLEVFWMWGIG